MDAYAKALSELSEIDSRIAALQQRRDTLRKFIDLGQSLYGPAQVSLLTGLAIPDGGAVLAEQMTRQRALAGALREHSAKAKILSACVAHIQAHGSTSTRDLLTMLNAQSIEVNGADKINALSVMLSKSDQFDSDRKFGWSLKSEARMNEQEGTPQGAPTPAGS
jgi:hypothetical protein